jgi:hypothetical protein
LQSFYIGPAAFNLADRRRLGFRGGAGERCPTRNLIVDSSFFFPLAFASGRAAAGEKKERSGLQSARDELIDNGAFITGE